MGQLLSPREKWPRHSKPFWRQRLKQAKKAGWWLRTVDHAYGTLVCSSELEEPCRVRVDSTAAGGETKAIAARDIISGCPHAQVSDDEEAELTRGDVAYLLQEAETLIGAVERMLEADEHSEIAEGLLRQATEGTDRAEALWTQSLAHQELADHAAAVARGALVTVGEPQDATEEEALAAAETRVTEVEDAGSELVNEHRLRAVRERLDRAWARVRG